MIAKETDPQPSDLPEHERRPLLVLPSGSSLVVRDANERPEELGGLTPLHERELLEGTHHELCTALTVLRLNVELVRIDLRNVTPTTTDARVHRRLGELDSALDRLEQLADDMRARHALLAVSLSRHAEPQALTQASLLPSKGE